jgi:DNA-directed RNA polymerase specialized sigma24 family protein
VAQNAALVRLRGVVSSAESFAAFVDVHTDSLFRTAYLLTGNPGSPEELLQNVLVRLYPRWDRVTDADQPVAYVRRCLVNAFVGARRRGSSRQVAPAERHDVAASPDLATGVADPPWSGSCWGTWRRGSARRWYSAASTTCPTQRSPRVWAVGSRQCAA